jgi:hypothetical protein
MEKKRRNKMADTNVNLGIDLKLTELIDKLSEKLGVATTKLEPLAKEGLDQYILRETVLSAVQFSLALIFVVFIIVGFKIAKNAPQPKSSNDVPGTIIFGVLLCVCSAIGTVVSLSCAIPHLGNALAPLPSVLGL